MMWSSRSVASKSGTSQPALEANAQTGGSLCVGVFQLYEARRTVDGSIAGDAGASVSLPLPDGDLGTRMSGELPRYWELEVEAKGADPIRFLVPVYRP